VKKKLKLMTMIWNISKEVLREREEMRNRMLTLAEMFETEYTFLG